MSGENPADAAEFVSKEVLSIDSPRAPEPRATPRTRKSGESKPSRVVEVDPFRCRVWELHDRLGDYVTDTSCKAEIESVAKHGQLVPALGRLLHGMRDFDVEIIYGSRRLFVARHLNVPLKVELRELSDLEAIVAMDIENRQRSDVSPYERGLSYSRWLRTPYFKSQDDIVQGLGVSASHVSRLLKLAQLPSVLVSAFASPLDMRESWGLELFEQWQDTAKRPLLAQRARSIRARPSRAKAEEVFRYLIGPTAKARAASANGRDCVVTGNNGSPLFRIKHQRNAIALVLPSSGVSPGRLEQIRKAIIDICETPLP